VLVWSKFTEAIVLSPIAGKASIEGVDSGNTILIKLPLSNIRGVC